MLDRRRFMKRAGLAVAAAAVLPATACEIDRRDRSAHPRQRTASDAEPPAGDGTYGSWVAVHEAFALSPDRIHMSAMLIASHPRPVREAIERYRRELDANPAPFLETDRRDLTTETLAAAADYVGGDADHIALTDSTTMGVALVYHGLRLGPGDEVITTEHDYYVTHESLRFAAERSGATVRRIGLFEDPATATVDEMATRLQEGITPRTRLVALTWVHSSTGMKLPVADLRAAIDEAAARQGIESPLLGLDGVHGFGVEDVRLPDLGVDFFMAGTHKWIFGPRGTGIVWARPEAWARTTPVIPTFDDPASWDAWARGETPPGPTTARRMTPGGFKPFEHQWALAEAFRFHRAIGKDAVQARTHGLATRLKDGLAETEGVTLHTPRDPALSSGIVCFDVDGRSPASVVDHLASRDIVASVTPYLVSHARLTPSIYNTEGEVDAALEAVREIA
jgi:isopenicillin-N epimerase